MVLARWQLRVDPAFDDGEERDDHDDRSRHEQDLVPTALVSDDGGDQHRISLGSPPARQVGILVARFLTMRVTAKGQVTIPKRLRDAFGIGGGSEVVFEVVRGEIVVRKVEGVTTRGQQLTAHLRGRGDVSLSTDEIMALTRVR